MMGAPANALPCEREESAGKAEKAQGHLADRGWALRSEERRRRPWESPGFRVPLAVRKESCPAGFLQARDCFPVSKAGGK